VLALVVVAAGLAALMPRPGSAAAVAA